jgi:ribonuclease P protein component
MLARSRRLCQTKDFVRVYKKGKRISSPNLRLFYCPTDKNIPRFGFVVSKKEVQKTVKRNRFKRLSREIVRALPQIPAGYDFIIQGRAGAAALSYQELSKELVRLFQKARILIKS